MSLRTFTRSSIATGLLHNWGDKDKILAVLKQVGAEGEAQALQEGYAEIVAKGLHHHESEVISATMMALADMGSCGLQFMEKISAFMGHADFRVQVAAFEALSRFGFEARDFASRATEKMFSDASPTVKAAAIRFIGCVGADEEAEAVKKCSEEPNELISGASIETLAMLGLMQGRTDELMKMLKKQGTCLSALRAIKEMGHQAPVETLDLVITAGLTKEDHSFREQALLIIGNLGEVALSEPYLAKLKSVFKAAKPAQRAAAAMAFGTIGVAAASEADALLPLLADQTVETAGPQVAQVLGTSAKRLPPAVRIPKAAALWALGEMKAVQHLEKMGDATNDKDWEVRLTAIDAIGAMGSDSLELAPQVAAKLSDPAFPVRASAAYALGAMGAEEHSGDLAQALTDQSHSVRLSAVLAMAELGEASWAHSHSVFKLIKDPMVQVQAAALRCLSTMGDTGCNYASVLATLINHQDAEVRAEAIEGLARMGKFGQSYMDEVAVCLNDPNTMVSEAAVRSLTAMGPCASGRLAAAGIILQSNETKPNLTNIPAPTMKQKGYQDALALARKRLGC